ncbi:MAG TPA: hypothetical protein VHP30_00865 [Ignavibacteriales bacterium]|nr:hypothetical protein [Ignavibacteriales bacterium]
MKYFLLLFSLAAFSFTQAQNFSGWDWDDEDWDDWDNGSPYIEFSYGTTKMDLRKSSAEFTDPGYVSLKLGYADFSRDENHLAHLEAGYVEAANISTEINSGKAGTKLNSDLWRFGIGAKDALGYHWGEFAVMPYTSGSINWSRFKIKDFVKPVEGVITDHIENFHEQVRFGMLSEGGISIQPSSLVSVNIGYEKAIVMPGVLFWKFLGSAGIEVAGIGLLDEFIEEIEESSPMAAPIANFILKSGFSYAMYQLRKDKMNWPFTSETPLTYDTFKFGVTFTF